MDTIERKIHQVGGSIQWHLTTECPNRCIHCYTYGKSSQETPKTNLPFEQLEEIYSRICLFEKHYGLHFESFNLTGGDPLYDNLGWRIAELLTTDKRKINILGIPERVTKENIDFMKIFLKTTNIRIKKMMS